MIDNQKLKLELKSTIPGIDIFSKKFYSNPDKKYHNTKHISYMLKMANKFINDFEPHIKNKQNLKYAIIGHDVIYDTRPYAEKRSAEFMQENCTIWNKEMTQLVMDTAHPCTPDTIQGQIIHDADLVKLASPITSEVFNDSLNVIEEISTLSGIDIKTIAEGNKKFLIQLLDKPQIFAHTQIRKQYEATLRSNIEKNINTYTINEIVNKIQNRSKSTNH